MIWKITKTLAWLSFLVFLGSGSYFFTVGEHDSYLCRSARWSKLTAPVLPIPQGFCGVIDPSDPRNMPPPVQKETADMSIYFKRKSARGQYPYKQTIIIRENCVFEPNPAPKLKGHTTITYVNEDTVPHAIEGEQPEGVNAAFGKFHSPPIEPGGKYVMVMNHAGDFVYRCSDMPEAKGTFSVYEW